MSYTTIHQCANDEAFTNRVQSAMVQQAWNNAELHGTAFAKAVRQAPRYGVEQLAWPTSVDYEQQYEYAVIADNPNPGGDPTVISDGNILSSVQAHWPTEEA